MSVEDEGNYSILGWPCDLMPPTTSQLSFIVYSIDQEPIVSHPMISCVLCYKHGVLFLNAILIVFHFTVWFVPFYKHGVLSLNIILIVFHPIVLVEN